MTNKKYRNQNIKPGYDFVGWASQNDVECADGVIIKKDSFSHNDGDQVPLVWNHDVSDPNNIIGHAILKNMPEGLKAYGYLNTSKKAESVRAGLLHGDINTLSIHAVRIERDDHDYVVGGDVLEVSLVPSGANPGAYIEEVVTHSDKNGEEFIINYGYPVSSIINNDDITHADKDNEATHYDEILSDMTKKQLATVVQLINMASDGELERSEDGDFVVPDDIQKVIDTMTDEELEVVNDLVTAVESGDVKIVDDDEPKKNDKEKNKVNDKINHSDNGGKIMKKNVFDKSTGGKTLTHADIMEEALVMARETQSHSLKDCFNKVMENHYNELEHADTPSASTNKAANTIKNAQFLFPDPTDFYTRPYVIRDDTNWVDIVLNGVKRSPYARIRTMFATLNGEEARARGYIKGDYKAAMVLELLRRTVDPQTVYIKTEIDRDDIVDMTKIDVVQFQRNEMDRQMDKEIAMAILFGDGRTAIDRNKIQETHIKSVLNDEDLFTIKYEIKSGVDYNTSGASRSQNDSVEKGIIRGAIRARKDYKGSGKPMFFCAESTLSSLLLIEDQNGRPIYDESSLAAAMRVSRIVTVPEMENDRFKDIYGLIFNVTDYTLGADKGGERDLFDQFDIDFNQQKYLMETRRSGMNVVPYSAIVLKKESGSVAGE